MLKGDLTSTPLAPLLLELADDTATGCLVITDSTDDEALVYFKNGLIYSVSVPGSRPQLGAKLVSSGALAPEALSEALEAQRSELQGWRLGELLVHLGYVAQPVVEAFVAEQVAEALWDLLRWSDGRWRFRKNVKAREDVGPPMAPVDLLETLRERGYEWESISAVVHGPNAIPRLSTRGDTSNETTLDNDAWSMLCKIDGERSVASLAADCGYTLFEAGQVIVALVQAGLVDIDEDIDVEGSELYGATTLSSAFAGDLDDATFTPAESDDEDALSKLARLVNEVAGDGSAAEPAATPDTPAEQAAVAPEQRRGDEIDGAALTVSVNRHSGESFAASIARVSGALSEVLGEVPPPDVDPEELAARRRRKAPSTDDPEWQRRKRLRSAAAAELASAQALIETLRPDHDGAPATTPDFTGDVPKVLSRATERERAAAREVEEQQRHAAEDAARVAAEQFARAATDEAERVAAEQEAARVAAEQAAADEAARLEAEAAAAAAAEQAARLAAEAEAAAAAEAERVQAERAAAEEDAWAEYWHREEAERAAAEEAARVAAEQEAERLAAEEAERQAAEEAARVAAELEAQRLAAEEAEREAAEQAARVAAEAQAEADRIAAEEAERQAAEEAARAAAEAKAEAAARRKAEKAAAAEAAKREDEAAAAAALLAEFAASSAAEPEAEAEPEPEVAYEPAPEEHAEAEVREPVSVGAGWSDSSDTTNSTDTAALLRELSSLGGDDEPEAPNGPASPSRPRQNAGPDKKAKKKIGLFGL